MFDSTCLTVLFLYLKLNSVAHVRLVRDEPARRSFDSQLQPTAAKQCMLVRFVSDLAPTCSDVTGMWGTESL